MTPRYKMKAEAWREGVMPPRYLLKNLKTVRHQAEQVESDLPELPLPLPEDEIGRRVDRLAGQLERDTGRQISRATFTCAIQVPDFACVHSCAPTARRLLSKRA